MVRGQPLDDLGILADFDDVGGDAACAARAASSSGPSRPIRPSSSSEGTPSSIAVGTPGASCSLRVLAVERDQLDASPLMPGCRIATEAIMTWMRPSPTIGAGLHDVAIRHLGHRDLLVVDEAVVDELGDARHQRDVELARLFALPRSITSFSVLRPRSPARRCRAACWRRGRSAAGRARDRRAASRAGRGAR